MPRLVNIAEQGMRVARRGMASSVRAYPVRGGESNSESSALTFHPSTGPVRTSLPDASQPADAFPIWLAALMASACLARANGENHEIRWDCVSGRALYTNRGRDAERIEPLGVCLMGGQTLAVYWMPGETAYTVEVYRQNERCA